MSLVRQALNNFAKASRASFNIQDASELEDAADASEEKSKKKKDATLLSSMAPPSLAERNNRPKQPVPSVSSPFEKQLKLYADAPYARALATSIANRAEKKTKKRKS